MALTFLAAVLDVSRSGPVFEKGEIVGKETYIAKLDWEVREQWCSVLVTRFVVHEGSYAYHAASDLDFYGWVDVDYRLSKDGVVPCPELEALVDAGEDRSILRYIREELCEWMA